MTDSNKSRAKKKDTAEVKEKISQESPKVEPTVEPKVEEQSASPQQVQVMSQTDSYVSDLVKEAPKSIEEVASREQKLHNILELPEECWKLHKKKYRYRWMAKTKSLEARLRTSIWSLCTRENSSYIKPHRFKAHGAVEQAGMLLAFTTEELGKQREEAPAIRSAELVKHYTERLPKQEAQGFYKPKDSGEADDGAEGFEMEY